MKKTSVLSVLTLAVLVCIMMSLAERTSRTQQKASNESEMHAGSQLSAGIQSPYDFEQYINQHKDEADLNEIWSRFGIPTELGKPGRCGCRGSDCPGTCKAEIINTLDASNSDYVIVRVCYAGGADCWYLGFKRRPQWRYVGTTESLDNQYEPPQNRIEQYRSRQWLVIKELSGRGTGFLHYRERWCELSDEGLRDVLLYPVAGHRLQGDAEDYEFKSQVSNLEGQSTFAIDIHYTVFTDGNHAKTTRWLSSHKYELLFEWDGGTQRFVLNESKSNLPKSENNLSFKYLGEYRAAK
jgi:hypothetical protein